MNWDSPVSRRTTPAELFWPLFHPASRRVGRPSLCALLDLGAPHDSRA